MITSNQCIRKIYIIRHRKTTFEFQSLRAVQTVNYIAIIEKKSYL